MDLQEIAKLTRDSVSRLTSDQYKAAFEDQTTGQQFAAKVNDIENAPRTASRPQGNVRTDAQPVQPASTGFDPSFDDEPPAATPVAAVTAEPSQPVAAATVDESVPELVHEYQPVDKQGRPIGGKQRFTYRTQSELIQKLTKSHSAASARIRELSRARKIDEITAVNANTKVARPEPPKELTAQERVELQLKCDRLRAEGRGAEAAKLELNATLGVDVTTLAQQLRDSQQRNYEVAIRGAIAEFRAACPEYVQFHSDENAQSMILFIGKKGLDETDSASYHEAFKEMKGYMEPLATATAVPAPPVTVATAAPATPALRQMPHVPLPTGLSRADGGDDFTPAKPLNSRPQPQWTAEKIDALPAESYKRIVRDPRMAALFDRVLTEHEEKKAAARRGGR